MKVAWCLACALGCVLATAVGAAPITLTSASIKADVFGDIITVGGGATNHVEDHDAGDLSKRSVTASVVASLPLNGLDFPATRSNSKGSFELRNNDRLEFTGTVDTTVFVKSSPFTGKGSADLGTDVRFSVTSGELYHFNYFATLSALISTTSTLKGDLMTSTGTPVVSFSAVADTTSQDRSGGQDFVLGAGDYWLRLVATTNADAGLGAGDASSIQYTVNLQPAGSVAIPLPPAALAGAGTMALLILIAGRRAGCSGLLR